MNTDEDQNTGTLIGQTYESDAARTRREAIESFERRTALRQDIDNLMDAHRAKKHAFTDAELELLLASPDIYVHDLPAELVASAIIARQAGASHPGATHVALDSVQDGEVGRWTRVTYILDAEQTIIDIIETDRRFDSVYYPTSSPSFKPFTIFEPRLTDAEHRDVLSIKIAQDFGKRFVKRSWLEIIRGH
jgi:hypothetical protein